jgi:hypothetical protein
MCERCAEFDEKTAHLAALAAKVTDQSTLAAIDRWSGPEARVAP